MKMGLEGDKRRFRRATQDQKKAAITYGIGDTIEPYPVCWCCGTALKGVKAWSVGDGKFECHRCWNE